MQKILIKNGIIITLGEPCLVLYDNAVLIVDGIIKQIGKQEEIKEKPTKIIDAQGKVILPGFINAHMHFYSTLVRGLGKAKPANDFQEILENLWWRLDKKLTLTDVYYSAITVLLDAIRHGTTTLIDHHASPFALKGSLQQIAKALKETGLRGCLCYELSDRDGVAIAQQGVEENIAFIEYCHKHKDDQLRALFGLHASFTLSDKTLEQAVTAASDFNVGFHVHVAEAIADQDVTIKRCGKRVVERLKEHYILGPKTIAAHCVHLSDKEIEMLAATNTMVVHNPQSNMNNAVGIADIVKLQKSGVLVGLGTDAMTVNMREELRVALWAQHLRADNPSVGFMEVANTLCVNNAKIIARLYDQIKLGIIAEGYAADIAIIDYVAPTPLNADSVLGHLFFGISQCAVDTTIARGKVLMENKKLQLDIDEEEIAEKSREAAEKLWARF